MYTYCTFVVFPILPLSCWIHLCATDNTGYDEYYLISGDTMKITDGQMATPSDNAKKGEIKRLFAQNLKSNRHSRVIMNKFISQVA